MAQNSARPISQSDLQQALGLMGSLPAGNVPAEQINLFTQLLGSQLLGGQLLNNNQQGQDRGGNVDRAAGGGGGGGGGGGAGGRPTRSSDSRSSSAYASRHQAAEQRRRTRINERLDLLRKMVPHAERANTACFLEEVIKYIDTLKKRNADLEKQLLSARNSGMLGNGMNAMASLGGSANAAVTAAAAALAAAAADAHQQMAAQQQQQQQQPSTSAGVNGNMSIDGAGGGSRDLSGSPPPSGIPRLNPNALANLQPSAVLAAAMRMGAGEGGQANMSAFLEQALLQGALNQQAQQHAARLVHANLASGSGQQEHQHQHHQQQQQEQEEKKRAPYGSTLPPELQKLLHDAPADDAHGMGLHGHHDASMMLAPAGLPVGSGSGGSGLQQRHGSVDAGSPMSSEESGAPQKKRKVLQG